MRGFLSDNCAGLCPEALAALSEAAGGHQDAYGDDEHTRAAVAAFRGLFGEDVEVFFVATGTAANTLAVAALTEPWQQVLCHVHSHYNDDESTAPERITHCRTVQVRTEADRLTPQDLRRAVRGPRGDVHAPQPGVVTISNPTEFGTLYRPEEVRALAEAAHEAGYRLHVDGARFANAVAALRCDPRELAGSAGVDALSFGGTKNGLAFGEAVLLFPQGDRQVWARARAVLPHHRKSTGHRLSKHRFVSAPFAATRAARPGGPAPWLRTAAHANRMAARLSAGLVGLGYPLRFPTEANGVFVTLSPAREHGLRAPPRSFYPFGDPAWRLFRFMCSFDTTEADVDALLADAPAATAR